MNNENWITRDGTKMTVNDMTEGHAKNALCMMIRKMRELEPDEPDESDESDESEERWGADYRSREAYQSFYNEKVI